MTSFRDFEKQLCIVHDIPFVNAIAKGRNADANALICYGYVDHVAGLSFDAVSLAKYNNGDCVAVEGLESTALKIRADSVNLEEVVPIRNRVYLERFKERIDMVAVYYENDACVQARARTELDADRHPCYPDDVYTLFVSEDRTKLEKIWVRVESFVGEQDGGAYFKGTLLNEPDSPMGCHINDEVFICSYLSDSGERILLRV